MAWLHFSQQKILNRERENIYAIGCFISFIVIVDDVDYAVVVEDDVEDDDVDDDDDDVDVELEPQA